MGDHEASQAARRGAVAGAALPCEVRVLGTVEVRVGDIAVDLGPPKQRALLVLLVLHVGEVVATDVLVDQLWGGAAPRTALHSIQIYVSELRKSFGRTAGAPVVDTHAPGYRLRVPRESIDIVRFERLVDAARAASRRNEIGDAVDLFRSAIALWRGKPLAEFAYEEFAQPHIRRTTALHHDALEQLATAELEVGDVHAAAEHAESLSVADPLRERAIELRMLALYRSGRHVGALRTYHAYRAYLADEVGAAPSPSLQRLNEQVLVHDPSLAPTEQAPTPLRGLMRNPYKGLHPFREADAADFFGRDELIHRMLDQLAEGRRLLALVGPSGCGKSSAVAAGLVPALRAGALPGSQEWRYATVVPGDHPVQEAEAAIARAIETSDGPSPSARTSRARAAGPRPALHPGHVLLVVDQFEELFRSTDEGSRLRFLDRLSETLSDADGGLTVVLTLRADHYDRPLMHPAFAALFTTGVINVLPMTAAELSAAVRQPAALVGVDVQPELVAAAVSEAVAQPGSLPLLQYALTEQFEASRGGILSLDDYITLGGLAAVLTRRAEDLFGSLAGTQQRAAMQVLLRMIRVGNGTADTCHRVSVAELAHLDLDPVVLSEILDLFARHRLLSFDADPVSNAPTVGVAHEALLTHWPRLAEAVDRHRAALRRYEGLRAAANDWEDSGRGADYLLGGARLADAESWRTAGALALTDSERDLIDASVAQREADMVAGAANALHDRRRRRIRQARIVGVGAVALSVIAGALAIADVRGDDPVQRVALFYFSGGEVGDIVQVGFDRAVSEFGFVSYKTDPDLDDSESTAEQALGEAATGRELVVTFAIGTDVDAVAADHPDTQFVVLDQPAVATNVTSITMAGHEGAYLAGAAAALRSRTGSIGFIGGVDIEVIWGFEAGFAAGARAVRPDVEILTAYLAAPPDFGRGFLSPDVGERAARDMYDAGADVIFPAAGTSGLGVFEAAVDMSTPGRHLWAIGVDSDQYTTVRDLPGSVGSQDWADHILTSVVKRLDVAVYDALAALANGRDLAESRKLGLADGAVELSYSGGFIDDLRPVLDELREGIVSGRIDVPCRTPDHPAPPPGTSSICADQ